MLERLRLAVVEFGLTGENAIKLISGGLGLCHSLNVDPEDFLEQAERDYELGGDSARLNAITNAKRAIHSQIDQALLCLGYTDTVRQRKKGTKKKFELFEDLGFVKPRILRRVTSARDVLEHEYRRPSDARVQEALDVAALFVQATRRSLDGFDSDFSIGREDDQTDGNDCGFSKELAVSFEPNSKVYEVRICRGHKPDGSHLANDWHSPLRIAAGQPLFDDLVRLTLAGNREGKVRLALGRFFKTIAA